MRGCFGLEGSRTRRRHLPGRDPAGSRDAYGHAGPRRSRQGRETRPDADLLRRFGLEPGRRGGHEGVDRRDRAGAGCRRDAAQSDGPQLKIHPKKGRHIILLFPKGPVRRPGLSLSEPFPEAGAIRLAIVRLFMYICTTKLREECNLLEMSAG